MPLWDRLLIRYPMNGVRQNQNFLKLITDTQDVYEDNIGPELKVDASVLDEWDRQINAIEVPAEVLNTIQVVRQKLEEANDKPDNELEPIRIYDRRWKKLVRLLRTSAFLNGRPQVDLMDCFLMVHVLWSHPSQITLIREVVSETIRKHGYSIAVNLSMLRRELEEFAGEVEAEGLFLVAQPLALRALAPVDEGAGVGLELLHALLGLLRALLLPLHQQAEHVAAELDAGGAAAQLHDLLVDRLGLRPVQLRHPLPPDRRVEPSHEIDDRLVGRRQEEDRAERAPAVRQLHALDDARDP